MIRIKALLVIVVMIVGLSFYFYENGRNKQLAKQQSSDTQTDEAIDTAEWKTYADNLFGFKLKYPQNWSEPIKEKINDPDFEYIYKVSFGDEESLKGNDTEGFSLFVYKTALVGQSKKTNGLVPAGPVLNGQMQTKSELNIDDIQNKLFYEFSGKFYTYEIVPLMVNESNASIFARDLVAKLDATAKTFEFNQSINLERTATRLAVKKNYSLFPAPALGTPICPVKNDKPGRSTYKSKHIDEDCCPDYDEWPNPRCVYNAAGYKAMLKGPIPEKLLIKR